jgi:hypothetical protein
VDVSVPLVVAVVVMGQSGKGNAPRGSIIVVTAAHEQSDSVVSAAYSEPCRFHQPTPALLYDVTAACRSDGAPVSAEHASSSPVAVCTAEKSCHQPASSGAGVGTPKSSDEMLTRQAGVVGVVCDVLEKSLQPLVRYAVREKYCSEMVLTRAPTALEQVPAANVRRAPLSEL